MYVFSLFWYFCPAPISLSSQTPLSSRVWIEYDVHAFPLDTSVPLATAADAIDAVPTTIVTDKPIAVKFLNNFLIFSFSFICFCYLTIKYHFYHTFSSAVCIKSKKNESFFIEILNKNCFIFKSYLLWHKYYTFCYIVYFM